MIFSIQQIPRVLQRGPNIVQFVHKINDLTFERDLIIRFFNITHSSRNCYGLGRSRQTCHNVHGRTPV